MVDYPLLLSRLSPMHRLEGLEIPKGKATGQRVHIQVRGNKYTPPFLSH